VDRSFLRWAGQRIQDFDVDVEKMDKGGHFVVGKIGRILLDRFEPSKHAFSGSESGVIRLPTVVKLKDDSDDERVLRLTA
jgi:hypothetical protein